MQTLSIVLTLFAAALTAGALVRLAINLTSIAGHCLGHIWRHLVGITASLLHGLSSLVAAVALTPLAIGAIAIGRWSSASHYSAAIGQDLTAVAASAYSATVGIPARLLGLGSLINRIEKRVAATLALTPPPAGTPDRLGVFEGYTVVGELRAGGSGARLYLAVPSPEKAAKLANRARPDAPTGAFTADSDRVVIKAFDTRAGATVAQIARESRAMEAASALGAVLEHQHADERFYYVMRYVPGRTLAELTLNAHHDAPDGLKAKDLKRLLGHAAGLLETLERCHAAGLWHKDVKPDNVIVDAAGAVRLVDMGLVTPLRSTMTLTTHGAEYFRDPELVRMALRGTKVHEIDGARFDVYGAGSTLYWIVEGGFPVHGSLSRLSKPCPPAFSWVIRRAMTDYESRYPSASAMLKDVRTILAAKDPWSVSAAQLPSMADRDADANTTADAGSGQWKPPPPSPSVARKAHPTRPMPHARHGDTTRRVGSLWVGWDGALCCAALGFFVHPQPLWFFIGWLTCLAGKVGTRHSTDRAQPVGPRKFLQPGALSKHPGQAIVGLIPIAIVGSIFAIAGKNPNSPPTLPHEIPGYSALSGLNESRWLVVYAKGRIPTLPSHRDLVASQLDRLSNRYGCVLLDNPANADAQTLLTEALVALGDATAPGAVQRLQAWLHAQSLAERINDTPTIDGILYFHDPFNSDGAAPLACTVDSPNGLQLTPIGGATGDAHAVHLALTSSRP